MIMIMTMIKGRNNANDAEIRYGDDGRYKVQDDSDKIVMIMTRKIELS